MTEKEQQKSNQQTECYNLFLYSYVKEYLNCRADNLGTFTDHLRSTFNISFVAAVVDSAEYIKKQTNKK